MNKCPYCGGIDGVEWRDYGNIITYQQTFGGGIESREAVSMENKSLAPKYCRCQNCGKRLLIDKVEKI